MNCSNQRQEEEGQGRGTKSEKSQSEDGPSGRGAWINQKEPPEST